jgi:DNA-binding NtrC family response regulator
MQLSPALISRLEAHHWPGNVRELANCIRRLIALSPGPEIGEFALEPTADMAQVASPLEADSSIRAGVSIGDMERKLLELTLKATGGNRSRAAEMLGISLRTVRNKVRNYGLPSWSSYVDHQ